MSSEKLIHIWQSNALSYILPTPELKTLYHLDLLKVYRAYNQDLYYLNIDRSWSYYLDSKVLYISTVHKYKYYKVI